MGQVFVNDVTHIVPMETKGQAGDALLEIICDVGIPIELHTDDVKVQMGCQ